MCDDRRYEDAAEVIKGAILHSQHRAVKATNGEQLSLYYAIGGYVSTNTRDGFWGPGHSPRLASACRRSCQA